MCRRFLFVLFVVLVVLGLATSPASAQSCPRDHTCTDPDYESCTTDACDQNHMCWRSCGYSLDEDHSFDYFGCTADCDSAYSQEDASCWAINCFVWW